MNYYNLISMMPKAAAYDADAQLFITATGISGTNATAINTLVLDLKAATIWTKMKALYPMVGGTATAHKFNLKNPLDTDAAFRLVFSGGWTHSTNGALPNGTNAYASTFFVPSSNLTLHNTHLSFYSRTSSFGTGTKICMGASSNTGIYNGKEAFYLYFSASLSQIGAVQNSELSATDYAFKNSFANRLGFFINSRTSATATTLKLFKNGIAENNATTSPTGQALNINQLYIGALRNQTVSSPFASTYDNSECAFSSIGEGLTDAEALSFYNAVQTYQTTLGRQV